jgi:HK97 family phage portal protein
VQILTREGTYQSRSANPLLPYGSTAPPPPGQIGMGVAGVQVSEQTALQQAAVYGSVSFISDSIATLPLQQWRMVGDEARPMPLSPVIQQPWSEITCRDFVTQGSVSMLLRGNVYGQVASRDPETLLPAQVKLVHPDHAKVRRLPDGTIETRYWNKVVPPDDVTRAMALSVPEGLVGIGPVEYLRNAIGLGRAQDLWAAAFFQNSARPDGFITVPDDLNEDEVHEMVDAWKARHQGIAHAHLPAILTGGAEWKPITMTLGDAQFLEQMQYSASVISGMIYRVPPHALGMTEKSTSWGNGIEQQELGYVRNTLLIWLCRWEDLFRSWLPRRQFVTFDLSQRLRGDTLQRWSAYQIARVIGAMNNEEIRAAEGLPRVTDPAQAAVLGAFDAPLNSAPVKAPSSSGVGPGGDKAD